jgi:arylsulfatase A-like enzyme
MSAQARGQARNVFAQIRAESWPLSVLFLALLLGSLGLRSKLRLMSPRWSSVARWLNLNDASNLSPLQRLDFFTSDLAVALFVAPALGLFLFARLAHRRRLTYTLVFCVPLLALTYLHMIARQVIGEYLSWDLIREAVEWATRNPDTITDYVSPASLFKLAVLVGMALVALVSADRASKNDSPPDSRALAGLPITRTLLFCGAAATTLCILATRMGLDTPRTPLHDSALWNMNKSLFGGSDRSYRPLADVSYLDGTREFRRTTRSDAPSATGHPVGSMRRANVVMFVVETGPAAVFDLAGEAAQWKGLSRLLGQSLVSGNHLTTYPYTSDAVFSILSGLYPGGRRQLLRHSAGNQTPALFTLLSTSGYATAVFAPEIFTRELDETMYRLFGIEEVHIVETNPGRDAMALAPSYGEQAELWKIRGSAEDARFDERLRADSKSLAQLLSYIKERHDAEQPFAVLYLPQASHAPWHGRGDIRDRGLLQMKLQAMALDDIVEKLTALDELEDTIIVVTADHGIRTKIEDPSLNPGFASSYMFRTPLMIFAPRAVHESEWITAPTSHVDIAPTVLALLGHPDSQSIGVGLPIWQATSDRRVYFLADGYGGFNGFVENGEYFQLQMLTEQAYGPSAVLEFDPASELVDKDGPNNDRVHRALEDYQHRQSQLIGGLMNSTTPVSAGVVAPAVTDP